MSGFNPLRAKPAPSAAAGAAAGEPKQMSSRLLTMKFMQRAANSNPSSRSQPTTPSSEHSAKRRRVDATPTSSGVTTPDSEYRSFADRKAIQAALKVEADIEAAARARHMLDGGETQWILPINLPPRTQSGDGEVTSEDEPEWPSAGGRQTYGSFKKRKKTDQTANPSASQHDADLSDNSNSEDDSNDPEFSSSSDESAAIQRGSLKRTSGLLDEDADKDLDKIDLSQSSYARSKANLPGSGGRGRRDADRPAKNRHRSGKTPVNMNRKDLQNIRNSVSDRGPNKQSPRRKRKTM